ncbi:MAG TPA: SpoIID/LytB domain-containing protein [Acidimicrobiales bacterium]|nr:SpoIID/LytB domain-containing protein [Acidimicrobiales bacterium]
MHRWRGLAAGSLAAALIAAMAAGPAGAVGAAVTNPGGAPGAAVSGPAGAPGGAVTSPAPGPGGWVVDRVSFEPLTSGGQRSGPLAVAALGQYRGAINVNPTPGGLAVVNDVNIEDYVRGISEVPPSWPSAALQAQAVAARTYALHDALDPAPASRAVGADICASEACQVYVGVARDREPGDAAWQAAVAATAGQILQYQGQPILAMYSSSNGGHTVAGGEPYLPSVPDPDDLAAAPTGGTWQVTVALPALAAAVGATSAITAISTDTVNGTVTLQLAPPAPPSTTVAPPPAETTTTASPKPTSPTTRLPGGTSTSLPRQGTTTTTAETSTTSPTTAPLLGLPLAAAGPVELSFAAQDFVNDVDAALASTGAGALPSTRFRAALDAGAGTVTFTGLGRGHGVGMSQYGALGKAQRGLSASDILAAYYGGLRPSGAPAGTPADLRVLLSQGQAAVTVGGDGFEVVDGSGHALAALATGAWRVEAAPGGRVRVLAPAGQGGALAVTTLGVKPAGTSGPTVVRLRLTLPATVAVRVDPATSTPAPAAPATIASAAPVGAPPAPVPPGPAADPGQPVVAGPGKPALVQAGDVTLDIPGPVTDGRHSATIELDAGGGRTVAVSLAYQVGTAGVVPRGSARSDSALSPGRRGRSTTALGGAGRASASRSSQPAATLAFAALLALVVSAGVVGRGTRRRRSLLGPAASRAGADGSHPQPHLADPDPPAGEAS